MRLIGGAALGVAVTLLTVVGVSAIRDSTSETLGISGVPGGAQIVSGADALALGCRPDESALLHRVAIREEPVVTVRCVAAESSAGSAPARLVARSVEPGAPARAPGVASRPTGRSWQKTAMVIGGSTATGAGVGGLIGGKKGALIGAAIGGGASTIYESAKR
jgi:hypothetical protein